VCLHVRSETVAILSWSGFALTTERVSREVPAQRPSDYSFTYAALAAIQSTASAFLAKPSISRSRPSRYLMTTCQPVPVLSGSVHNGLRLTSFRINLADDTWGR